MLFGRLSVVRFLATAGSGIAGVLIAWYGGGYWALVCQSLVLCLLSSVGVWMCYRWLPGLPRRCNDLRQMLGFGGSLTGHGMATYLAGSLDKVLLGRFCGADCARAVRDGQHTDEQGHGGYGLQRRRGRHSRDEPCQRSVAVRPRRSTAACSSSPWRSACRSA